MDSHQLRDGAVALSSMHMEANFWCEFFGGEATLMICREGINLFLALDISRASLSLPRRVGDGEADGAIITTWKDHSTEWNSGASFNT